MSYLPRSKKIREVRYNSASINLVLLVKLVMYVTMITLHDIPPLSSWSGVPNYYKLYRESFKIGLGNQMNCVKANIDDTKCHRVQSLYPPEGWEHGIEGCCLVYTNHLSK